jgi:PIN domain nuclease of toxin-antitoxin system
VAGYLIDSHIFLWAIDAPEKLLAAEGKLLSDASADIAVSAASLWELSIKVAKGGLHLSPGEAPASDDHFAVHARKANLAILPIQAPEAEYVRLLPPIHRDPFDRLIIAQALLEQRVIVTRDAVFARYPGVRLFTAAT